MLGYGFVNLDLGDSQFLYAKYEVDVQTGFRFYQIAQSNAITEWSDAKAIADFLDTLPAPADLADRLTGSLTLRSLPASPREAFYDTEFRVDLASQLFSLTVRSPTKFGFSPQGSAYFRNLNLTLTQSLSSTASTPAIALSGTVDVVIFGHSVTCTIQLSETQLILTPDSATALMLVFPGGELNIREMTLLLPPPLPPPQIFYAFGEADDDQI